MMASFRQLDRPFWQKLIQIGVPVSLQSMLFSLLGVVDIFMVSQLGEAATAAVGVGNRIFFFNLIVIVGASGAVSVLASQYFGAGNLDGVRRVLAQSWVVALLFTLPFMVLYLVAPQSVVSVIASDPQYVSLATDYLWVTGASLFCTALVVPVEGALRSVGEAKLPTRVSIIAIIINAILNALLIFGLFGFPELGVLGAGIGTSISRLCQTAILFYALHRRYPHLLPTRDNWRQAKSPQHRARYYKVAWPMIVHDTGWAAGILVYNVIVGQLGVSELAIISLLSPIESVLISAFLGFAVAASIILGNEIGAQNYQRVESTAWWYVLTSCALALLLALLCYLAKPWLAWLIGHSPLEDSAMALNVCLVMAFGMVLRVFNMVGIGGVLKSGGDIRYSIFIDLFGQWAIGIPLAYFTGLVLGWPLHWVLMVIWLEEVAKIFLTTQRIFSKRWINNLINDGDSPTLTA
ncbi:MATE family efflux transporter [Vibrio fluvialis]|uniref:MATE family efflux transporter n=1 Tax=Vibrio fluvialis TaxID=676 RepID=UPI00192C0C2D|nr:MATE family efflux transporter [Vibrio fluvialis]EKO3903288.1 MATE family efflux transporter [Vibrio fluvialis]EME3970233.1 MATE family efflux transporter [Vibrio fluvialis]MBL4283798.1 MATE family efflux transporter [Vibrio fluvialis]MBY7996192.1 MATE family efflux transporter [Vibrio fluvialis]MBY8103306.1 MATE family efflux transporter [Vibrio fluvialis]